MSRCNNPWRALVVAAVAATALAVVPQSAAAAIRLAEVESASLADPALNNRHAATTTTTTTTTTKTSPANKAASDKGGPKGPPPAAPGTLIFGLSPTFNLTRHASIKNRTAQAIFAGVRFDGYYAVTEHLRIGGNMRCGHLGRVPVDNGAYAPTTRCGLAALTTWHWRWFGAGIGLGGRVEYRGAGEQIERTVVRAAQAQAPNWSGSGTGMAEVSISVPLWWGLWAESQATLDIPLFGGAPVEDLWLTAGVGLAYRFEP